MTARTADGVLAAADYADAVMVRYIVENGAIRDDLLTRSQLRDWVDGVDPLQWKHAVIPLLPAGAVIMAIVALGHDLGTTLIIMIIVSATLFYGGVRMKVFGVAAAACAVGALVLAATSGNRMGRIFSWLGMGSTEDAQGLGYQALNGQYALASGGS